MKAELKNATGVDTSKLAAKSDLASRYRCKELIDKVICDEGFIWNPSICECECEKLCDIGQYLDYEYCKCGKKLRDKLVEECRESIDENEMTPNDYGNVCNSCTIYIVLFAIAFLIIIGINSAYFYFHWYLKKYCSC